MPWLEYLLAVDWTTAGKTVVSALVGAGLGSALVQGWFSAMGARRRRTAQATYLAMRLAVLLDAFGLACWDMIHRALIQRTVVALTFPKETCPVWEGLPALPPYPEDSEGWVSLDKALATRCLRLRSNIQASEGLISRVRKFVAAGNEEALQDTVDEEAARLGLEARRLAEDLQRQYGLSNGAGEYDYASPLEVTLKRANEANRQRASEPC
jgi:hypothetical protein